MIYSEHEKKKKDPYSRRKHFSQRKDTWSNGVTKGPADRAVQEGGAQSYLRGARGQVAIVGQLGKTKLRYEQNCVNYTVCTL